MKKNISFDVMLLDVIACKWSRKILEAILLGINRPGRLQKELSGISTKVMNESLNRLVDYGFLIKTDFDEIPPKVEFTLTELGKDALQLIQMAQTLQLKYSQV